MTKSSACATTKHFCVTALQIAECPQPKNYPTNPPLMENYMAPQNTAHLNVTDFTKSLRLVNRVMTPHNHIPVLSRALLSVAPDGQGTLTTSTIDNQLTVSFPMTAPAGFAALIFPPQIITAFSNSRKEVSIQVTKESVSVQAGGVDFISPNDIQDSDFPIMNVGKTVAAPSMAALELHKALRLVSFAISNEETRYYLNGAFFTKEGGKLKIVATDGHKLCAYQTQTAYSGPDFIMHKGTVAALVDLLPAHGADQVTISVDDANVGGNDSPRLTICHANWTLTAKTIDGTFPNWKKVIPKETGALSAQIKQSQASRVAIHNGWYGNIEFDGASSTLRAYDDAKSFLLEMPTKAKGECFSLASIYVQQITSVFGDVTFEGSDPKAAFLFKCSDPNVTGVIMPRRK